jgi:3-hydroxy acid dehydrogenase/malonic semialdehyde reductase
VIALITGATSGIGKAAALRLASGSYDIIITGRRKDRLEELSELIRTEHNVDVLSLNFDVRNNEEVVANLQNLDSYWRNIDVLVNNAGLAAGLDTFQDADINDWERMLDTNVKGLLYVSKIVSSFMIENKKGHIVNIGSTAAKEVYPKGNVYCASKHAVDAISKAMRIDMLEHGIKVTEINPGLVETEFSVVRLGDQEKADAVYKGMTPLLAEDIADAISYVVSRPPHVCINDMVITPTHQANSYLVKRED